MAAPKVRDVMTPSPITIGPSAPLTSASRLLGETQIRHLPVVDDDERLVGIITERDLRGAAFAPALWEHLSPAMQTRLEQVRVALGRVTVGDLMTPEPMTATPETGLAEAAARMFEHRIGCLPVVEGGRVVGILTETDALGALADILGPRGRLALE
jgi:acetoin utilization protein AcuB